MFCMEEALRDRQEILRAMRERLRSSIRSDHGLFPTSAGSTVCPKKKKKDKSKPIKYRRLPLRRKKRTRQQAVHAPILKEGERGRKTKKNTLTIPTFNDDGIDDPPPKKVCPGFPLKSDNCFARHQHHHVTDQVPDPTTKHNNNWDETTFEAVCSKPPPPSQNPCTSSSSLNKAPIVIDDTSPDPEK